MSTSQPTVSLFRFTHETISCTEALAQRIKSNKENPLSAVTVITPTGQARTSTALAVSQYKPQIGVNYLTLNDLANHLSLELLAKEEKVLADDLTQIGTLKALFHSKSDLFKNFCTPEIGLLPNTEQVLIATFSQLDWLSPEAINELKKSERYNRHLKPLLELYEEYNQELEKQKIITEPQLYEFASQNLKNNIEGISNRLNDIGNVIFYLPDPPTSQVLLMLQALSTYTKIEILINDDLSVGLDKRLGLSKNLKALFSFKSKSFKELPVNVDANLNIKAEILDEDVANFSGGKSRIPKITNRSYTTPDEEVKAVVKEVYEKLTEGYDPHQLAVLFADKEPYRQLLHNAFVVAEIPFTGQTYRSLKQSWAGTILIALLDIAENGYNTNAVEKLLDMDSRLNKQHKWKTKIREAAIANGAENWKGRLYAQAGGMGAKGRLEKELVGILEPIFLKLQELGTHTNGKKQSWEHSSKTLTKLLEERFDQKSSRAEQILKIPDEKEALNQILQILKTISALDKLVNLDDFSSLSILLRRKLSTSTFGRKSRFGRGVFVGSIHSAAALSVNHIWVLGLAEGIFPKPPYANSIIQNSDWQTLFEKGYVEAAQFTQQYKVAKSFLDFTHAKLAAKDSTNLSFPIADPSQSSELIGEPCRWMEKDEVEKIIFPDFGAYDKNESFLNLPVTQQEFNLLNLAQGGKPVGNPKIYQQGIEMLKARKSSSLTSFDGYIKDFTLDKQLEYTATKLETYVGCPQAFFFKYILGLKIHNYEIFGPLLSPLEFGNLIHKILEKFNEGHTTIFRGFGPSAWAELKEAIYAEIEKALSVRRSDFKFTETILLNACLEHLENLYRYFELRAKAEKWELVANEKKLENVEIELNNNIYKFTVKIDLIEKQDTEDPTKFHYQAIDYKTGQNKTYKKIDAEKNLSTHGKHLQHLIYGLALKTEYSPSGISSGYIFGQEKDLQNIPLIINLDDKEEEIKDILTPIMQNLNRGIFPHGIYESLDSKQKPTGEHKCEWCDPYDSYTRNERLNKKSLNQNLNKSFKEIPLEKYLYPYYQSNTPKTDTPKTNTPETIQPPSKHKE